MALIADAKTQNAAETGASALSLLSSLKAGLKGAKSSGFAELMAVFESALPQKKETDLSVKEEESRVKTAEEKNATAPAASDPQRGAAPVQAAPEKPVRKTETIDKAKKEEPAAVSEKETDETEEPIEAERTDIDIVPEEKPEILADKPEGQAETVPDMPGQDEEGLMAFWLACQAPAREPKPTGCSPVDQGEEAELEGDLDADTAPVEGEEDGAWAALLGFTQEAREIGVDASAGALRVSSGVPASSDAAQAKMAQDSETPELLQNGVFSAMTAKPEEKAEQTQTKAPLETLGAAFAAQTVSSEETGADPVATKTDLQTLFAQRKPAAGAQAQTLPAAEQTQNQSQIVVQAPVQNTALLSETPIAQTATSSASSSAVAGIGAGARAGGSYHFTAQLATVSTKESARPSAPALEQVTVQLRKMVKEGAEEMTIRLRPEELGRIDIKLEFTEDKKVHGTITADKASTLQLLQKDADALQKVLQEAGLQADAGCLDFSLRGDGQDGSSAWRDASDGFRSGLSDDGDSFEGETLAATDEIEEYYITPERVNLRV